MPSVDSLLQKPAVHVDLSTMAECQDVVAIPHRFVPYGELVRLHAVDRKSLGECWRLNHAKATTIKALIR